MSAATTDSLQEPAPTPTTFSYAQAARGRASATAKQAKRAPSENSGALSKRNMDVEGGSPLTSDNVHAKRATSEGRMPEDTSEEIGMPVKVLDMSSSVAAKLNGDSQVSDQVESSSKASITPPSSEFGTNSLSTLQKEDDGFSGTNASSESTWEKQSQSSQNGSPNTDRTVMAEPASAEAATSWEEETPAEGPPLKDAPLPTVNFWQKRQEALAAKAKVSQPAAAGSDSLPNGQYSHPNITKSSNPKPEGTKQDSKKKAKMNTEEKGQLDNLKGGKDRKPKALDDKVIMNVMTPPPPPGDAVSWPTPETAVFEDRKKSGTQHKTDDGDKERDTPQKAKASGKKAWTQMDFVPSAVFETHLPGSRRGGRGPSGGGRDSQPRGVRNNAYGSRNNEKLGNASVPSTPHTVAEETKVNGGPVSSSNTNAQTKRASSAGPATSKESRKTLNGSAEKADTPIHTGSQQAQSRKSSLTDFRRPAVPIPATPQMVIPGRNQHVDAQLPATQQSQIAQDAEKPVQGTQHDTNAQRKASGAGRRNEGPQRGNDSPKESIANSTPRERDERSGRGGRNGRGRGGNNHTTFNSLTHSSNSYTNVHAPQFQAPYSAPIRSFSNHERTPSQTQGMGFPTSPHRGTRSNSGRPYYPTGYSAPGGRYPAGPAHVPNIQTDMSGMPFYQPEPQGVMSAIPYNPYEQQPLTVWDMVQAQMEYYFSVDNLCKDVFLRKHMDSQGFVFLSVLANFNRILQMTTDIEIIRYVCLSSQKIEFKPGQVWQDGLDRLRARDQWTNFVLPMDQRDPSAQNDGPTLANAQAPAEPSNVHDNRRATPPNYNGTNGAMDFQYQSLNAIAPQTVQAPPAPLTNGNHPPLSAAVSEFSPSAHSHITRRFVSPDPHSHQDAKPFPDAEIPQLQILVRQNVNSSIPAFHSTSSRTFSNGSIDGRSIGEELGKFSERQSRPLQASVFENDRSARSRSPFAIGSPTRGSDQAGKAPPVFWMKDKNSANTLDSSTNVSTEYYSKFRADALAEREEQNQGKAQYNMHNLYNFWSHFLIRNFNGSMYEEFRQLALDDEAGKGSDFGFQALLEFYTEALLGSRAVLDDSIARHYLEIVSKEDMAGDRPAFKRLRTAWRNGAFNHMNRHKIVKNMEQHLREELDR